MRITFFFFYKTKNYIKNYYIFICLYIYILYYIRVSQRTIHTDRVGLMNNIRTKNCPSQTGWGLNLFADDSVNVQTSVIVGILHAPQEAAHKFSKVLVLDVVI